VWHAPGRALPHSFSHVVLACGAAFIAKVLLRQFARVSRAARLIEKKERRDEPVCRDSAHVQVFTSINTLTSTGES
jgi:hypothetical protein